MNKEEKKVKEEQESCLSDLGGILQLFGGVTVIGAQIVIYLFILAFVATIPSLPPNLQILYNLIAQMMLVVVVAMILSGIIMIAAGIISFWRSGSIGGFLALFFGIPVIIAGIWLMLGIGFYPGIAHFIGGILGIIGGILSIIPSIKPPRKPKGKRKPYQRRKERIPLRPR